MGLFFCCLFIGNSLTENGKIVGTDENCLSIKIVVELMALIAENSFCVNCRGFGAMLYLLAKRNDQRYDE